MNHVISSQEISYEGSDLEALMVLRRYRRWIFDCFHECLGTGRAIEFGAGIGHMAELFLPHVDHLDLVEPSPNLIDRLKERFSDSDRVGVLAGTLEKQVLELPDEAYQSVILVNVLEHVEDDPAALRHCLRILEPGGYLLLFVPALPMLFSDLDRLHGHFRRYGKSELENKLSDAGFEINETKFFEFLGMFPWWLMNTVLGATDFNPTLVGLYDRVCVPITRRIESIVTPPVGKNLVAIARRPE